MRFGRALREELFVRFFFFFLDAREHSDSGGCTLEALSLFIPSVSTCTSSQKVLCLIETSLEPSGYLVALSAFKEQMKIAGLLSSSGQNDQREKLKVIKMWLY